MKKVVLIRHAEPVPADAAADDFNRPLVPNGERDSEGVGRILKASGLFPGLFFASPAERAIQTASIIARLIGFDVHAIIKEPGLYNRMHGDDLLGLIRKTDETVAVLFFVSHEPGISQFAGFLCSAFNANFPKAGVLALEFDIENWSQAEPRQGVITLFDAPGFRNK
jgi:phosphohistidine phosphatase